MAARRKGDGTLMPQVELGGKTITYAVRISKRAKRIIVSYSHKKGLELVYPVGTTSPAPEDLLRQKSSWVISTVERFRGARDKLPKRLYEDGEVFSIRGKAYTLKLRSAPQIITVKVQLGGAYLLLTVPDGVLRTNLKQLREAVETHYRVLAAEYLPARVAELAAIHGFDYAVVRIKNQKTRWGSCSAKGNINLNLRLMMAPDPMIDYVIIHELCHLRELNHSLAFWALVESCCPDYRRWRNWLKQHGPCLIF